jgi:hypothetical protein
MDELAFNQSKYFKWGQVRHLPQPLHWERCCWTPGCTGGCVAEGTYQVHCHAQCSVLVYLGLLLVLAAVCALTLRPAV